MSSNSSAPPAPAGRRPAAEALSGGSDRTPEISVSNYVSQMLELHGMRYDCLSKSDGALEIGPVAYWDAPAITMGLRSAGLLDSNRPRSEEGTAYNHNRAGVGYHVKKCSLDERPDEKIIIPHGAVIDPGRARQHIENLKAENKEKWGKLINLGDEINKRLGTKISYTHEAVPFKNSTGRSFLGSIPPDQKDLAEALELAFETRNLEPGVDFELTLDNKGRYRIKIPDKAAKRVAERAVNIVEDLPDMVNKTTPAIKPEIYLRKICDALDLKAVPRKLDNGDIVIGPVAAHEAAETPDAANGKNAHLAEAIPDKYADASNGKVNGIIIALRLACMKEKSPSAAGKGFTVEHGDNGEMTLIITPPAEKIHFSPAMENLKTYFFSTRKCRKTSSLLYHLSDALFDKQFQYEHHQGHSVIKGLQPSEAENLAIELRGLGLKTGGDFMVKGEKDGTLRTLSIPDATEEKITEAMLKTAYGKQCAARRQRENGSDTGMTP